MQGHHERLETHQVLRVDGIDDRPKKIGAQPVEIVGRLLRGVCHGTRPLARSGRVC